jgi:hypothetical protein
LASEDFTLGNEHEIHRSNDNFLAVEHGLQSSDQQSRVLDSVQVEQVKQQNIILMENAQPISVWTSRESVSPDNHGQ